MTEGDKKKVVVIDDEEDVTAYLTALLDDNGYRVYSASDGSDGLRVIKNTRPDLVCLDILMPGETGVSLYHRIRTDPEVGKVPVIIISGMNLKQGMEEHGDSGTGDIQAPEAYIEKPIKPANLIETVRSIIG